MATQKIILVLVACLSLTLSAAQAPIRGPLRPPMFKPGMSHKEWEKAFEQQRRQHLKEAAEHTNLLAREAWKRLLRVSEGQWTLIEPKYEAIVKLIPEARAGVVASGGSNKETFHWFRYSKFGIGKTPDEMTDGEKVADALVELLEDPNSTGAQIRQKIDALQKARETARKALPEARKELAAVLTTPRQEAVFLLMGCID
jgi:hypothetical protein